MNASRPSQPPKLDETDSTRVRVRSGELLPGSGSAAALSSGGSADKLTSKLAKGRILLASLPSTHPEARLLRIAILRRDETLLDGLLLSLGGSAPVTGAPKK